jgi:hypothetical protein
MTQALRRYLFVILPQIHEVKERFSNAELFDMDIKPDKGGGYYD